MDFWHDSYRYASMINNIPILNNYLWLEWFRDGSFCKIEAESMIIPYKLGHRHFTSHLFLLMYSRFVKQIKHPIGKKE
ncbi:hypothetical protein ACHAXS_012347 [Conticribra weissflogii]